METEKSIGTDAADASLLATAQRLGRTEMAVATPPAQGSKAPSNTALEAVPATNVERDAAVRLGTIHHKLECRRETPLDKWVLIPEKGLSDNYRPFTTVLGEVYGYDNERLLKYGPKAPSRFALYKKDLDAVMSGVMESTFAIATRTLSANAIELTSLWKQLNDPKRAEWLHRASEEIVAAMRREMRKEEADYAGEAPPPDVEANQTQTGYNISYLTETDVKRIVREKVAKMVPYAGDDVLNILFEHPEGMRILGTYAKSAEAGTVLAMDRVRRAIEANRVFAEKAIEDKRALRYPFFVLGGVVHRNLRDVPGFTEFALDYCQVLTRDSREPALMFASGAVAILSVIIAGPGAPFLIASLVLGGADLAFSGMGVYLAFLREREQALANRASGFKGEANQWATPVVYQDTIMAGTAGLLSAIAFFRAGKELHDVLKATAKAPVGAIPAPPPKSTDAKRLIATENKSTDGRATGGVKGTNDSLTRNDFTKKDEPPEYLAATWSKKTDRTLDKLRQEERSAAFKKELADQQKRGLRVVDEAKETPAQQRMAKRELTDPKPFKETVPAWKLRADERQNIREQIARKQQEIDAERAALDPIGEKMNLAAVRRNKARRQGDTAKLPELERKYDQLRDQFNGFDIPSLIEEKRLLEQLLERTSTEYFESLTSAASKKKVYVNLTMPGALDKAYKAIEDELTREHVRPRSVIFGKRGFLDKIIWEQQIFLFNLPKNLKVAPSTFNTARRAVPYAQLDRRLVEKYINPEGYQALVSLEAEVDRDIERLLAEPRNVRLWESYGYFGPFK